MDFRLDFVILLEFFVRTFRVLHVRPISSKYEFFFFKEDSIKQNEPSTPGIKCRIGRVEVDNSQPNLFSEF